MHDEFRNAIPRLIENEALPVDKFGHQPRLYALTLQIGEGLAYDDEIVFAAAWLHDIGVFIGNRPDDPQLLQQWDHVAYACGRVPDPIGGRDGEPGRQRAFPAHVGHEELVRKAQPRGVRRLR